MKKLQNYLEKTAFGVCSKLGEKFGIPIERIRILFIYSSFLTFGSPIVIYLSLAFIMNFRKYLRQKNNPVWYF
jgi:phage shock protein C